MRLKLLALLPTDLSYRVLDSPAACFWSCSSAACQPSCLAVDRNAQQWTGMLSPV